MIDKNGAGVADALVVASGVGFNGWAWTNTDGDFHLRAVGLFVSVRHAGLRARLLRSSELIQPLRIELENAGESARKLPACDSLSGGGGRWIGGGLKVNLGRRHFKGPVNGEHDSDWYVKVGKDTLHIVDGHAWHAGLPWQGQLASSENTSIASWEFEDIVGLDLSGRTKDGKRWRWLGAPLADAIEYDDATQDAADSFDEIIKSVCFGSITPLKK